MVAAWGEVKQTWWQQQWKMQAAVAAAGKVQWKARRGGTVAAAGMHSVAWGGKGQVCGKGGGSGGTRRGEVGITADICTWIFNTCELVI